MKNQFYPPFQVILHSNVEALSIELAMLDNHSMRSLHLVDFINREFWESQMLCSSLSCRIQPLFCSKRNRMVLFLSKKCSENDACSRTSLKIIDVPLSATGWRWTCHTKSFSVLPFQQRLHCRLCSELLYSGFITPIHRTRFNISFSTESITMKYKHESAHAKSFK